jgi:hypothetical protein
VFHVSAQITLPIAANLHTPHPRVDLSVLARALRKPKAGAREAALEPMFSAVPRHAARPPAACAMRSFKRRTGDATRDNFDHQTSPEHQAAAPAPSAFALSRAELNRDRLTRTEAARVRLLV